MKKGDSFITVGGIIAVTGWFIFFGLGLFINSEPFRKVLMNHFDLYSFVISLLTYTPTNVAFLCMAASFCGGCSNNLIIVKTVPSKDISGKNETETSATDITVRQNPFNCMIRGFVVYIAFLAGVYVLANATFSDTTPAEYAKAAGVASLLAFIVGYDQSNFLNLVNFTSRLRKEA